MSGLAKLCKAHGSMEVNGVRWLWDYAENCAVPESDMPKGSVRRKASDRAKRLGHKAAQRLLVDE